MWAMIVTDRYWFQQKRGASRRPALRSAEKVATIDRSSVDELTPAYETTCGRIGSRPNQRYTRPYDANRVLYVAMLGTGLSWIGPIIRSDAMHSVHVQNGAEAVATPEHEVRNWHMSVERTCRPNVRFREGTNIA
jgi:hypothetical protein